MLPKEYFEYLLKVEGGYVNHKYDRGGKTNFGITKWTFNIAKQQIPELENITSIKELTVDLAYKIYDKLFWEYHKLEEYPFPLDIVLLDSYVNHSPKLANKVLQRACNNVIDVYDLGIDKLKVDGKKGNKTNKAIEIILNEIDKGSYVLASEIIHERTSIYLAITDRNPKQKTFFRGWIRRLVILKRFVTRRK